MITDAQLEQLRDIFDNTENHDKITIRLDAITRTMIVEFYDLDEEWFLEMRELTPHND